MRSIPFIWTFLGLAVLSRPAMALPDGVIFGQFSWIVPDSLYDQYPNGELNVATQHAVPYIKVTHVQNNKIKLEIAMPKALVANQTIISSYVEKNTTPDGTNFVNPLDSSDRLTCDIEGEDSWDGVRCNRISFGAVAKVPLQTRLSSITQRFGGSLVALPVALASRHASGDLNTELEFAEPIGALRFFTPEYEPHKGFAGEWSGTMMMGGSPVDVTLSIDGPWGVLRYTSGQTHYVVALDNAADLDEKTIEWLVVQGDDSNDVVQLKLPDNPGNPVTGTWTTASNFTLATFSLHKN